MTSRQVEVVDRQELLEIPPQQIASVAQLALTMEQQPGHVEVALVDDAVICDLHERFLDDPTPTDVITFPMADEDEFLGGVQSLGEIVVSTETALRQAPEFGRDPVHEVLLYVVHGVLHLCGYDDHEEDDRERMSRRQEQILEAWLNAT